MAAANSAPTGTADAGRRPYVTACGGLGRTWHPHSLCPHAACHSAGPAPSRPQLAPSRRSRCGGSGSHSRAAGACQSLEKEMNIYDSVSS